MKKGINVIKEEAGTGYRAYIIGHPEWWGRGDCLESAIGDLILSRKGKFDITSINFIP